MPLTRQSSPMPSFSHAGEFADAEDREGTHVLVSASYEAIEDFGWEVIWDTASNKYDRYGGFSVHVTTDDCNACRVSTVGLPPAQAVEEAAIEGLDPLSAHSISTTSAEPSIK